MLDGAITRELEHKLTDWTETYFRIPSEAESSFLRGATAPHPSPPLASRARPPQSPRAGFYELQT